MSSYLQPVVTAVMAIIILDEKPDFYFIFGAGAVLSGVFLVSLRRIIRKKTLQKLSSGVILN